MRRVIHGAVLGLTNLAALLIGFAAYHLLGPANQIAVQVPIAAVVTIAVFAAWLAVSGRIAPRALGVREWRDGAWIYTLAFLWSAIVFVPAHLITQGYVTAFSNITALWTFQLIVNAVAVALALALVRPRVGAAR